MAAILGGRSGCVGSTILPPTTITKTAPAELRVRLETIAGAVYRRGYEQEALPDRPDRRAVGVPGASAAQAQVRHPQGRPAGRGPPRGVRRRLLPPAGRPGLAADAARLPALADRVRVLPRVAGVRGVGAGPRPVAGGVPGPGRGPADARDPAGGQPDGQDDPPRRPQGVRRGEKRCSAASGSWPWTRWG